jgi:hypothetical protein
MSDLDKAIEEAAKGYSDNADNYLDLKPQSERSVNKAFRAGYAHAEKIFRGEALYAQI